MHQLLMMMMIIIIFIIMIIYILSMIFLRWLLLLLVCPFFIFIKICWELLLLDLYFYHCNFKGNPNSQDILNWIIQILHYYYSKQDKNIKNSQIIEQNFIVYSGLRFLRLPSSRVFQFPKRHKWSFVKYIVSFFWFENG